MRMGRSVVDNCSAMAGWTTTSRMAGSGGGDKAARLPGMVSRSRPNTSLYGVNTPWQDATVEPIFKLLSPCPPTTRTLPLLLPI